VLNCNIEASAKLLADTCKVQNCNFIGSSGVAVLINDDPHYVTDCNFISCVNAVEIDAYGDGSYDFDALKFSGNTFDVNNSCGSPLTVTKLNGSNPSTYTGSAVTFAGSVPLTVTVVDVGNTPIENAQVAIFRASDGAELLNEDTNPSGVATESYSGATGIDIYLRVRKSSPGATKYVSVSATGTITAAGFDVKITLTEDPNA